MVNVCLSAFGQGPYAGELLPLFADAFRRMSFATFQLLSVALVEHPDVVDDFFELCGKVRADCRDMRVSHQLHVCSHGDALVGTHVGHVCFLFLCVGILPPFTVVSRAFCVNPALFGPDPCPGAPKKLIAQLGCGDKIKEAESAAELAALKPKNTPVRYGWAFIYFVGFIFTAYCALGIAFKIRREKATGLDVIPHLETWKGLPSLVKDGVVFSIECVKTGGRPNYDAV